LTLGGIVKRLLSTRCYTLAEVVFACVLTGIGVWIVK